MKKTLFLLAATFMLPVITTSCANNSSEPSKAAAVIPPNAVNEEDKQWTMANKNNAATRYSTLNSINTDNVKNLRVSWTFSTGVLRGHEGGPLVIGNTMYVHTPFPDIVYALDLTKEGAPVKWKYVPKQDPQVVPVACCDTVNRGLAYADGKIFLNQLDTNTVALDAETGKEGLEGEARGLQDGPDRYRSAHGYQRQSDLGHQRWRVRCSWICNGKRCKDRQTSVAHVQYRTGS